MIYRELGLVCTQPHSFTEHTPEENFSTFIELALDVSRQCDESPNSIAIAQTTKRQENSSSGNQTEDRSQQTVAKHLSANNTRAAALRKLFKNLDNETELAKAQMEHTYSIFVGFFIFHCSKLRILELSFKSFTNISQVNKIGELEMDTDLLYLAIAETELENCIRHEKKPHWKLLRANYFSDSFFADAAKSFLRLWCGNRKAQKTRKQRAWVL